MNKMKNNFILILIRVFAFYYFQDCDLLFNFYMIVYVFCYLNL